MLVQLAAVLLVLMGMAGLGVDVGFVTLERRMLQNAVDAAALSGAIDLVQAVGATEADVAAVVARNGVDPAAAACQFVAVGSDNAISAATGCNTADPTGRNAVRVTATTTRDTFFMRALGIDTVTVTVESVALVSAWNSYSPDGALFIVCGFDTNRSDGTIQSILQTPSVATRTTGPWSINPNAIGREFTVHDPNPHDLEDCGATGSRMKGLLDVDHPFNAGAKPTNTPVELISENGTRAGPTRRAVEGVDGCQAGLYSDDASLNNCVMILPIAVSARKSGSDDYFKVVKWLPFRIRRTAANGHAGTLLNPDYVLRQTTTDLGAWAKGAPTGPTSVRTFR